MTTKIYYFRAGISFLKVKTVTPGPELFFCSERTRHSWVGLEQWYRFLKPSKVDEYKTLVAGMSEEELDAYVVSEFQKIGGLKLIKKEVVDDGGPASGSERAERVDNIAGDVSDLHKD